MSTHEPALIGACRIVDYLSEALPKPKTISIKGITCHSIHVSLKSADLI
jgi:hypothetical protein